jgi:hypothetical protein
MGDSDHPKHGWPWGRWRLLADVRANGRSMRLCTAMLMTWMAIWRWCPQRGALS